MDEWQKLIHGLTNYGITISEKQLQQFKDYYSLLVEWNTFMNLTAITELSEVILKHFLDSISIVKEIPEIEKKEVHIIDVGTGAGFPGIPLKIVFPKLKIVLLDSLAKRVKFLNEVIEKLGLEEITAIHGRAEDIAQSREYREQFDLCVSRAVANLNTLSEYCLPFVKIDGYFVSYKSEKLKEELEKAKEAIKELGGGQVREECFYLSDENIVRNLCMIKKVKTTPKKYPRKAGLPSKEPIFLFP